MPRQGLWLLNWLRALFLSGGADIKEYPRYSLNPNAFSRSPRFCFAPNQMPQSVAINCIACITSLLWRYPCCSTFCSVAEKRLLGCNAKSQGDAACYVLWYEALTCSDFQFPEKNCSASSHGVISCLLPWHNYLWIKRHQQKQTTYFNFSWIISMIVFNPALLKGYF